MKSEAVDVKQVQIVIPFDKTEAVFNFLLDNLNIKNVMKFNADNAHLLQFRVPDDLVGETTERLKGLGVGVEYGFIDILDLKASLPRESEEVREGTIQREAMLAVEEIYENVKGGASISFDFLAFTIFAAAMAGFGLMQNNVVIIVASMLLSPLMGPMLGVALGYVVGDNNLFVKGTMTELIALGLSFAVGAIMAVLAPLLHPSGLLTQVHDAWGSEILPAVLTEITRRGVPLIGLDIGIAVFSGAAIAISVTRGDMSSLVGVAISAALMPPAVNVGMMFVLGIIYASPVAIGIGVGSLVLLVVNIIIIDVSAIIMFRLKRLTPIANKSATWTAVTEFTQIRSRSLYHDENSEPTETESEEVLATFTPAPTSQGPPIEETSKEEPDET
ncbi:MAG: TIGR00341 family protein [Candidatus Thorarchaeota archaeon]